ncbi:coiled-coil domain-containing protein [Flavobacterium silvaticum]|uniref:PorT family protein n=1 Tax=Flavobacterium silvaticum TaxID=1852020 RepID=A0A972JGH0_9FLAO|nr:hypothetical protein [Flavobacterium silvaticum]NMH28196.1 hypothetical protein [Flavobacterium silvaticum]
MKKIIFALVATGFAMFSGNAQNVVPDTVKSPRMQFEDPQSRASRREFYLKELEEEKKRVEDQEKFELKKVLEKINDRVAKNEITADEARKLKEDAAKNSALNIDQKLAIIETQKKLLERDNYWAFEYSQGESLEIGLGNVYDDKGSWLLGYGYRNDTKKVKYDKRSYGDIVVAGGLSNAFSSNRSFKDSPYKVWQSGFAELGWTERIRLMKDNNFWRLAAGASLQLHAFTLTANRYVSVDGDKTLFTTAAEDLKYQKFRVTNLVFPVYLEFGPSKKYEYYDHFRYSTVNHWKAGIGGYAGMNLWSNQVTRYYDNGRKIQDTQQRSFNASNFVYGLGAYVGYGPVSIYATYDLQPLFKNGPTRDNVFSIAIRLDL